MGQRKTIVICLVAYQAYAGSGKFHAFYFQFFNKRLLNDQVLA